MGKDKRSPSILSNTFDWSKLDRHTIANEIWKISPIVVNRRELKKRMAELIKRAPLI